MAGLDLPHLHGDDDLLALPTRRRLFALLSALGGPATTAELATRLSLHPNGVRSHLQRMRDAGLVTHRRVSGPRGRPRDEWAVAAAARPGGDPPDAYAALARWLARSIPVTPRRLREVEASGREIGRELTAGRQGPPRQVIGDVLAALGFHPEAEGGANGGYRCRLRNCPYRDSVRESQEVVCTLHRGLTRGILDEIAPAATLTRFVPRDPYRAGCELEVDGLAEA